jgi:hypothetical protein
VGNGRPVDAANTATAGGSDAQILFNVVEATGDYNRNGIVDAADYVVWRKTDGTPVAPGSGADGDGDGMVDQDDYDLWRANFGNGGGIVFPEPAAGSSEWLVAAVSVDLPPVSETEASAVESGVSSATIDSVFVEWPRTSVAFPSRGSGAALAARGIAASAIELSDNLLLSLRPDDNLSGQGQDVDNLRSVHNRDQLSSIDELFSTLGEQSAFSALAS